MRCTPTRAGYLNKLLECTIFGEQYAVRGKSALKFLLEVLSPYQLEVFRIL